MVWNLAQVLKMDLAPRLLEYQVNVPTAITFSLLDCQTKRLTISSLKGKEIDDAQTKARHKILQSKLEENEIYHSCNFQNGIKPVKTKKIVKERNPTIKVSSKVTSGKGESNMRLRQITRLTNQICECIKDIDSIISTKSKTKDFISPHELQVKKKRLKDFLKFGRRILFTVKREINNFSSQGTCKKLNSKWLRILSKVSRTLYQLLLGLKNIFDNIVCGSEYSIFYKELLSTSWRLLFTASTIGIKFENQNIFRKLYSKFSNVENIDVGKPSETHCEHSIDRSSDLLYSSLDDKCLALLQPRNIRRRIAALAIESLSKKVNEGSESKIKDLHSLKLIRLEEEGESKQKENLKETINYLKIFDSQQRVSSHSSENSQNEILSDLQKKVSPTRLSFGSKNVDSSYLEIIDQKNMLRHHATEGDKEYCIKVHQENVSPVSLMTQINYLNERVHEIDEDWVKIEKDLWKIRSHALGDHLQGTNHIILSEAQNALRELRIE